MLGSPIDTHSVCVPQYIHPAWTPLRSNTSVPPSPPSVRPVPPSAPSPCPSPPPPPYLTLPPPTPSSQAGIRLGSLVQSITRTSPNLLLLGLSSWHIRINTETHTPPISHQHDLVADSGASALDGGPHRRHPGSRRASWDLPPETQANLYWVWSCRDQERRRFVSFPIPAQALVIRTSLDIDQAADSQSSSPSIHPGGPASGMAQVRIATFLDPGGVRKEPRPPRRVLSLPQHVQLRRAGCLRCRQLGFPRPAHHRVEQDPAAPDPRRQQAGVLPQSRVPHGPGSGQRHAQHRQEGRCKRHDFWPLPSLLVNA